MPPITVPDTAPTISHAIGSTDKPRPEASFVVVGPDLAARWLGKNKANRNLREKGTGRYARDMSAGNWLFTGETIKFDWNGRLLDGQHRLTAIVETGESVLMLVVRNIDPEAQDVMDSGMRRSPADMLKMHSVEHPTMVSAVTRLALTWQAGLIKTAESAAMVQPSHAEIREMAETDPFIGWASSTANGFRAIDAKPSAVGFALWLGGPVDSESIRHFLADVNEMRTAGAGDPRHTLLRRLQMAKQRNEKWSAVTEAYFIIRAWGYHRAGSPLKTIKTGGPSGSYGWPQIGLPA